MTLALARCIAGVAASAMLLTQISACLNVPREVHEELVPRDAPENNFSIAAPIDAGSTAKNIPEP